MSPSTLGRTTAAAALAGAAVGVGAFAWGSLVERNRFTVRREVLPVLEPGSRSITVLHLSDLHLAPWQAEKIAWVRDLVRVEPDLVVDTGDNIGHPDAHEALERALEPFRGVAGVYVDGSNDHYGPVPKNPLRYFGGPSGRPHQGPVDLDVDRMHRYFQDDLGWLDLNDRARGLELRGNRLELFGTSDAHLGWDRLDKLPGNVDDLRENVGWQDDPTGPEPLAVAVTHAPYQRVLNAFVTQGADVIFAGHTHGGQVQVPGYGALVTNCDLPRSKVSGLTTWSHARHTAHLEVSAGLGTSIYAPVRFSCKPEAVVVTLTA